MSKFDQEWVRNLEVTEPSASEMDDFHKCPTLWFFRWRIGVKAKGTSMALICGSAVSKAMEGFYAKDGGRERAIAVFENAMMVAREKNPLVAEDHWQEWQGQAREVVELYVNTYPPKMEGWETVIGTQVVVKHPCKMKLDLLIRNKIGQLVVYEQKMLSGFADIGLENLKYDMGFQPILYSIGAGNYFEEPCNHVVMDYLIRGKMASGRYKSVPASVERYEMVVEDWKKDMALATLEDTNGQMNLIDVRLAGEEMVPLLSIPKYTRNCLQKFGSKTYECDYYKACSVNMHPMQVVGVFENGS